MSKIKLYIKIFTKFDYINMILDKFTLEITVNYKKY